MALLELILAGAVGGVTANFLADYLWQGYKRPSLDFNENAKGQFLPSERGHLTRMVFLVPIKNVGRSSARNCKAELRMRGFLDEDRYEVQATLPWSDLGGLREDINRKEQAAFEFIRYESASVVHVDIAIPSGPNWEDKTSIMQYIYDNTGELERIEYHETLPKTRFLNEIEWEEKVLRVTSENASVVEADIEFGDEQVDAYGVKGTEIRIDQRPVKNEE